MSAPVRDLVFISYSHLDRQWLERLHTMLKGYIRFKQLQVWDDRQIRTGDYWHPEIGNALQRARVGVLLVSPNFIDSDFIMDEELPVLLEASREGMLKLAPVLVSDCPYDITPIGAIQFAHKPLSPLDKLDEPDRNSALTAISRKIFDLVSEADAEGPARRQTEVPAAPERPAPVPLVATNRVGDLHGVPALPPHHLPRTEDLARLKRSLLDRAAVGITAAADKLGLHGQGGIGKTVLASALARDEEVRRAFPDGVYWVTVGQQPDLLRLQAELVREITGAPAEFSDVHEGHRALEALTEDRSALLVVDDVWDATHARTFDVRGEKGRLLITTRDASVLTAIGAEVEEIERLSPETALALLAAWAGTAADRLPEAAAGVARECGYLPLALSVAGARVRDGASWEDVLEALEQGRLEFLDHPYASVFGSLRLSVDALPEGERQRYLELAVFPEDVQVPESMVLRLWAQTGQMDAIAARDLLARLKSKALLERGSDGERRFITLHDLQHDFVRLLVNDLPAVNVSLLNALAAELPTTDDDRSVWHTLPRDEPYSWLHLGDHLVAAGRREEFRELLLDPRWLEAKLRAVGMSALLSDFAAFPRDADLSEIAATLRLSSHVVGKHPEQLPSQLLARLLDTDREPIRQMLSRIAPEGVWLRPLTASLPPHSGLVRTLSGHSRAVNAVAITPDGRQALSASDDQTLKLWDLESGRELRTLSGHSDWVRAVAITPDERRALSASGDGTLKLWDLQSGRELRTLSGHSNYVRAAVITPDGRHAVSASWDQTLKVWDLESGREIATFSADAPVHCCAVTPDGRMIVAGDALGRLHFLRIEGLPDTRQQAPERKNQGA